MEILRSTGRKRRCLAVALAVAIMSLLPAGLFAGFPGDIVQSVGRAIGGDVGNAVGSLGSLLPGGGGLVDQALGGVVGMPGQMVFGSAIKDFEGATGRSIDKLGTTLSENVTKFGAVLTDNLGKADVVLGKNIAEVNNVLAGNVSLLNSSLAGTVDSLDQSLQRAVAALDESLRTTVGGLDVVATKSSESVEIAIRRLILYGCILVFLSFAIWQTYAEVYKHKRLRQPLFRAGILLGALSIIAIASFLVPLPNGSAVKALTQKHLAAYEESMARLDFTRAAFNASQLRVLDSTSTRYEGLFLKATVMRDVLLRPGTYSTPLGRSDLALRIDHANDYLRRGSDAPTLSDPDLLTLTGFIVSQMNPSREGMMTTASLAATALEHPAGPFALKPLAVYLLDGYLQYPIADADFEIIVGKDRSAYNSTSELQYKGLDELQAVLTKAQASGGAQSVVVATLTPLDSLIAAERLARDLYFAATPLYTEMVLASARASAQTGGDAAKAQFKETRDNAAKELVKLFEDYSVSVRNPSMDGTTGRLGGLRGLHAIYSRAHAYLPQAAGVIPEPDIPLAHAIHTRWLDDQALAALGASSQGPTAPGYFLMRNIGGISFRRQEKLLIDFEKDLHAFIPLSSADATKGTVALKVAQLAALTGLSTKTSGAPLTSYAIQLVGEHKASIKLPDLKSVYLVALSRSGGLL